MLYPLAAALALWNFIVLLIGSIFTTPETALIVGNAWLLLDVIVGIALGKLFEHGRHRQENIRRIYHRSYPKPYLIPAF